MTGVKPARARVLVVDDEQANGDLLALVLGQDGYVTQKVADGEAALVAVAAQPPDLVLLDINLPGVDGFEVCRHLKADPATRLIPVVLLTGLHDRARRIHGIQVGADDFLAKPFDAEELRARVRSLLRLKRYTDDLDSAESVILSLALTVEARNPYTEGHCQRLAWYASALGQAIGLDAEQISALHRGGYLHDVGKIGIPDAILLKPSDLTPAEYELMKQHTVIGERLLGELRSLAPVRPIVRHHHERRDGSGYPDGLRGDEVPLLAEIVAIADTFDAITTDRPYRRARSWEDACGELQAEAAAGRLQPDLVETFITLARSRRLLPPPGQRVSLRP